MGYWKFSGRLLSKFFGNILKKFAENFEKIQKILNKFFKLREIFIGKVQ